MKTILLFCLLPLVVRAQTNEPIVQIKWYHAPNLTNRVTLGERERPREISGEVWYAFGKRFMFYIQCESQPDIDGRIIIVQGYPGSDMITRGQKLQFTAQKIGVIHGVNNDGTEMAGEVRELWEWYDIEKASLEDQRTSDRINAEIAKKRQIASARLKANAKIKADAAALKSNQAAAAKGDVYGLLRMGERYRDGEGVDKDLAKARDYLQRAADAGSPTAKDELSKLPAP